MMNRICKTNIIKRTLLAVMAAVTLFTSAILPSQAVYASTNVVADLGNSIKDLKEAAGVVLGNSIYQGGGSDAVSRAESWVGRAEYVWGACSPGAFDDSGLVSYCITGRYARVGTTYTFLTWPQTFNPQPGDICVCSGHCGIYVGNGEMIHSATEGLGVRKDPVHKKMIFVKSIY